MISSASHNSRQIRNNMRSHQRFLTTSFLTSTRSSFNSVASTSSQHGSIVNIRDMGGIMAAKADPMTFNITSKTTIPSSSSSTGTSNSVIRSAGTTSSASVPKVFNPWPISIVESEGDYQEDSYLEEIIGGPLYSKQNELPSLPIPSTKETIDTFLSSALPLAESKEEIDALLKDCKSFPEEAKNLQTKLEKRKQNCDNEKTSWLQLWWNQMGYLQVRDPIVINVSYFFQLEDDKSLFALQQQQLEEEGEKIQSSTTKNNNVPSFSSNSLGIKRGAAALVAMAEYRKLVCSGTLPTDTIGRKNQPLCSAAFKYMFHSCRIPHQTSDTFKLYDPSIYKHCIVAHDGNFYAMDFLNNNHDPLPIDVLENGLQHIVDMTKNSNEKNLLLSNQLGILTSGNRDTWAKNRDDLLRLGGEEMKEALMLLESGAFVLCLDKSTPITKDECASIYWHGNKISGYNRWFDKSMQLTCQANGNLGFMGEHSMMDGMPAVGLCSHIKKCDYKTLKDRYLNHHSDNDDISTLCSSSALPQIKNIFETAMGNVNDNDMITIENALKKAKHEYDVLIDNQQLSFQSFQGYGSDYIKKAGYSPDGFVQMALQLASYRLFKKQVGTYEASQVRFFLHGRTETTRSVSKASEAFVKAMGLRVQQKHSETADKESREEKLTLLRRATESHSLYLKNAARGYGVDRHFLGLSLVADGDKQLPSLFHNPVFIRSKQWRLSTSTLPNAPGFGPVVEDGVGIGYELKPDCCYFTITSREKYCYAEPLSHLIEAALIEMQMLMEQDKPLQSKL